MRQAEIERLLPAVFRRTLREGSLLSGVLAVMEGLHAPAERVLGSLDSYFDPRRAPDAFVPFLARWVDLERLLVDDPDEFAATSAPPFASGYGRLRELVAEAAQLSRWRGTTRGLLRSLEVATGVHGFGVDERVAWPARPPPPFYAESAGVQDANGAAGGSPADRPFHVRVRIPPEAVRYRALIVRIVESEKPAYVTYDLLEEGGPDVHPTERAERGEPHPPLRGNDAVEHIGSSAGDAAW